MPGEAWVERAASSRWLEASGTPAPDRGDGADVDRLQTHTAIARLERDARACDQHRRWPSEAPTAQVPVRPALVRGDEAVITCLVEPSDDTAFRTPFWSRAAARQIQSCSTFRWPHSLMLTSSRFSRPRRPMPSLRLALLTSRACRSVCDSIW